MDDQNKNTLLAIALSILVLIGWQILYINPKVEAERQAAEIQAQREQAQQELQQTQNGTAEGAASERSATPKIQDSTGDVPGMASEVPGGQTSRDAALGQAQRVPFENEFIRGSINLQAARIDDLELKNYHVTIDESSPLVTLLSPSPVANGYFAEFGFAGSTTAGALPGPGADWRVIDGETLTPEQPITLQWSNEEGLTVRRTITLDDTYLFSFADQVINSSDQAVSIAPYGRVTRFGEPSTANIFVLHEGLIGYLGEQGLLEIDYGDAQDEKEISPARAETGWLGITDKYWATALIPSASFKPRFAYFDDGRQRYQSDFLGETTSIPAGGEATFSNRLFAGAKKTDIIDSYEARYGITKFDLMIDWGWFYWITKPLFKLMNWLYQILGNFGVSILVTTVIIKAILFPLANLSYASMAKMKKVQPEMQKIKESAGEDRLKLQQEMMALYKREKINPAAGCWPILIQIPVFFALYKVIYVTIEMRHAPFFGWIEDLSAPDPTSILNLFGLLPYDSPAILAIFAIGIWPLIMGITMFLQMQMNPAPPDPTQQMIFKWMPVVFTFMLATFPAGLVIYWAWNNFLSIIQQGVIMRKHGVKIELWDNLKSLFTRKSSDSPAE